MSKKTKRIVEERIVERSTCFDSIQVVFYMDSDKFENFDSICMCLTCTTAWIFCQQKLNWLSNLWAFFQRFDCKNNDLFSKPYKHFNISSSCPFKRLNSLSNKTWLPISGYGFECINQCFPTFFELRNTLDRKMCCRTLLIHWKNLYKHHIFSDIRMFPLNWC